jgi:hypothetical protein
MSISTARGRLRPEMRSPVDRATTVFYSCFVDNYRLSCNVSTLLALFSLPKMAERRFRPLGGVLDRKWRHQSIPWPRFGIGRFWNFASISHGSKVIRLFRFACKMPFENSGEGVLPWKKIFHRWDPQKALPCGKRRRLRHKLDKSTGAFRRRLVTRSEKNWGYKKCATSPYWADEPLGAIVMKVDL